MGGRGGGLNGGPGAGVGWVGGWGWGVLMNGGWKKETVFFREGRMLETYLKLDNSTTMAVLSSPL